MNPMMGMGGMGGAMPPGLPPGMMPSMAPLPYPPASMNPQMAMSAMPQVDPATMLMMLQQAGDPMAMAGAAQQGGYEEQAEMSPLLMALMQMGAMPPTAQV